MPGQHPPLTAMDLIGLVAEFVALTPDRGQWSAAQLADNPPRALRLGQLMALLGALGLERDLPGLLEGRFLKARRVSDHGAFLERARAWAQSEPGAPRRSASLESTLQPEYLRSVFARLMRFRLQAHAAQHFNSGVLEAAGLFGFGVELIGAVGQSMRAPLAELDQVLALLIDPQQRSFSREELIRSHGFPSQDLLEVDADWA